MSDHGPISDWLTGSKRTKKIEKIAQINVFLQCTFTNVFGFFIGVTFFLGAFWVYFGFFFLSPEAVGCFGEEKTFISFCLVCGGMPEHMCLQAYVQQWG